MSARLPRPAAHGPRGFTLVELLVVVAIIVVLVAILLPSLAKARETSDRTRCGANLHGVGNILSAYAAAYENVIPIGYTGGKWQGYQIWTSGDWAMWGTLWHDGLLKDGRVIYCTNQPDPRFQYDTKQNPWPPNSGGSSFYRSGYQFRPSVNWSNFKPTRYVKWAEIKFEAIAACVTGIPNTSTGNATLQPPHKGKITVLYGDNSVRTAQSEAVMDYLRSINSGGSNPSGNLYLDETTKPAKGLWAEYDKF